MVESRGPVTGKITGSFVVIIISFICSVIANFTPYWLETWWRKFNTVRNVGLWAACVEGLRQPDDYWGKIYYGCWWLYVHEFEGVRKTRYINPPWFQAVQAFATLSFIAIMVSCILMIAYYLCLKVRSAYQTLMSTAIVTLVSAVFMGIAVIIFGVRGDDRDWMPRPEFNYFSWSFGLAVVASIFAFVSGFILLFEALALRRNTDEEKTNFPKAPRPN